ncbi:aminotransferase class V-fold PLP-dependent enzyme [Paraburkholderia sp. BCC1884]|uniref:aminotransferase class V-fold PLP-dependent enzyme n=1 Tax=Paraburkholderia sp. BCC1884 TaxID=2562668 RepID=UPI0011822323|nr:aminotransferase class V-fold PLP-dependent enzyme [Paraburkholderia sp. BCC1884]
MSTPLSSAAVDALRARAPGTQSTTHFNHAGASLPSSATLEAIQAHLWREATTGPMEAAASGREQTERARTLAAQLFNARPEEIALTTGNSSGWSAAFAALGPWQPGDRILVGRQEWGGNLSAMRLAAQRDGVSIETIPCDATGAVDPQALETLLDERVRLIALTWLPANGGLINPAAAIGQVARRHAIPYFIDAAQALGQVPTDVVALGCDVLTGVGRKALRGPRGTGFLYIRQAFLSRLTPVLVDSWSAPLGANGEPVLRDDAARFESSERALALHCGLANALQEALEIGVDTIRLQIDGIAQSLRQRLSALPGVTVLDLGAERSGLIAFDVAGLDALTVQRSLAAQGITIGSNGTPYTPLDMEARGLQQIARASVSYLTTEPEIDRLLTGIRALVR